MKICNALDILYRSNKINTRMSYKEFYNQTVNKNEEYKKVKIVKKIGSNTQMVCE